MSVYLFIHFFESEKDLVASIATQFCPCNGNRILLIYSYTYYTEHYTLYYSAIICIAHFDVSLFNIMLIDHNIFWQYLLFYIIFKDRGFLKLHMETKGVP